MEKSTPYFEPILANTERDLRKNIREISTRFNNNPDLARLVFVNPILAFEDVGVQLSAEMKRHIMDRMRFPPKLKEKTARLEKELKEELAQLKVAAELPFTPEQRADLLFNVLRVKPLDADKANAARLESNRTKEYRRVHPLIAKLAEYERARQGSLIFHTRERYDDYKAGRRKHRWIKSVRFKI
jgi:hypothetical protein